MNTPSNAMPEARADAHVVAPAAPLPTRPFYWSFHRELWENRSLYIAPLAVAAVMLFGFLVATLGRALTTPDLNLRMAVLTEPSGFAAGLLMVSTMIVAIFYSLDALYGERRDRSILFWKSLPVSDTATVLTKAFIPIALLPLFTFVLIVITQLLMALVSTLVVMGSHLSVAAFWTQLALFRSALGLLYHLVTVHILWHAPFYAWMLLVSAWARRTPFLWAILPPLGIGILEKMAFNTTHFVSLIGYRLSGPQDYDMSSSAHSMHHSFPTADLGTFLIAPGLWTGLLFTAICLVAAIRLRRYRGPI